MNIRCCVINCWRCCHFGKIHTHSPALQKSAEHSKRLNGFGITSTGKDQQSSKILMSKFILSVKEKPMAQKLDDSEIVEFKELLIANSTQTDTLVQLLIEEGIISEQKFFAKFKQVQAQYQKHESIR